MTKNKGVSPVIGIVLMIGVTVIFISVVGTFILSENISGEDDLKNHIESFNVQFEDNCKDNVLRVTLNEYELDPSWKDGKYVNVSNNDTFVGQINTENSSILINISGRGEVKVTPSILRKNGKRISADERVKRYQYYCE